MEDSRRDLKDDHLNSLLPDVQVERMLAWFKKHGVA
jgi:hypothetical protein